MIFLHIKNATLISREISRIKDIARSMVVSTYQEKKVLYYIEFK